MPNEKWPQGANTENPRNDPIRVEPMAANFGAIIDGCDLSQPLVHAQAKIIYDAFLEHQLLVFRKQNLDADQQAAFAQTFGTVQDYSRTANETIENPKTTSVTNLQAGDRLPDTHPAPLQTMWHSDGKAKDAPTKATVLYGVKIPPRGGDTHFVSMYAAYDGLGEDAKQGLEKLSATYESRRAYTSGYPHIPVWRADGPMTDPPPIVRRWIRSMGLFFDRLNPLRKPVVARPIVIIHPETNRKSLLIGGEAWRVKGWPRAEGIRLVSDLRTWACANQAAYTHKWQVGDLLMWDNRCVLHRASGYDAPSEPRLLRRCVVLNDASV